MVVQSEPLHIFCSFAPEDEAMYNQLYRHLRLPEREGLLTLWHRRLITAGIDWAKAIDEQLTSASIILLLISPAFFASDYCYGVEMQQAMQQQETGKARVIPILLRSVDWTLAPFTHLSLLPSNRKSVAEWSNRDAAFTDIVIGLRRVIEELTSGSDGNISRTTSGVWNVPYRRNPHFTGRDELLEKLDQQLSSRAGDDQTAIHRAALTQPQAIKGLGGMGKTQIAVEYAYRAQEQGYYIHTLWINAANEETLITSFTGVAELLPAFPSKGETDQHKLIIAIKRWLEQCPQRWLLIFDNADDVSLIQEYFPPTGNGSILLTTRASAVGSLASSIEVETMSFIEGTHLLLRRAQRFAQASDEEANEAGNIVVALDHFPLALDQAGAYIDETQCSFADYLSIYQSHRQALLARRGIQSNNYPDSVATTWSLSFQKVEQDNPAATELLRLCALLAPDKIPEELIRDGVAYWPPLLQQAAADSFTFNQMVEELLKFSLIKRLTETQMLSIHRLVQAIQTDRMEQEEQREWAERMVRAVNAGFPLDPKNETVWSQCLRYLEQVQTCHTLIQQHVLMLPEAANVLDRTATYLREHALYSIAEPLCTQATSIYEHLWGPNHPETARSLNSLANLYQVQSKFAQAEPLYLRTLAIREQQLGSDHLETGRSLNNLALLYTNQNKFAQAEPLLQRALTIKERQSEPDLLGIARSMNNLAITYREQGKFAQAESLFLRATSIYEQKLGSIHPELAYGLNNLAILYSEQRKYEQAERLCLRALAIKEQVLGSVHPESAYTMGNLAVIYSEQGKYEQAELLYTKAYQILEQTLSPDHPQLGHSLTGLANLYREQSKYAQAELFYIRALRIREQALVLHHPDTAETLYGFAKLREVQNNNREAVSLYQRALAIRVHALGSQHPKTAETQERLRAILAVIGQLEDRMQLGTAQQELEPGE